MRSWKKSQLVPGYNPPAPTRIFSQINYPKSSNRLTTLTTPSKPNLSFLANPSNLVHKIKNQNSLKLLSSHRIVEESSKSTIRALRRYSLETSGNRDSEIINIYQRWWKRGGVRRRRIQHRRKRRRQALWRRRSMWEWSLLRTLHGVLYDAILVSTDTSVYYHTTSNFRLENRLFETSHTSPLAINHSLWWHSLGISVQPHCSLLPKLLLRV